MFFQDFVDRLRPHQGVAAEITHYALPDVEKENILKEGFQRRNGDLDLLHSFEDVIAFALALNAFEKCPSLLTEKAQILLRDPGRPGLQQVNRRRIDIAREDRPALPPYHYYLLLLFIPQAFHDLRSYVAP